jgi:hypothetical protein
VVELLSEGAKRRPISLLVWRRAEIAVKHEPPVRRRDAQLVGVRVEDLDAIMRGLREGNAVPGVFVRAVDARLGLAGPSGNFEFGATRTQVLAGHSIFDGMHWNSSRLGAARFTNKHGGIDT